MERIKIIGIAGSLRKDSFNMALLKAAKELETLEMDIEIFSIDNIPLYNEDLEKEGIPEIVKKFKNKIKQADAVLIASPEYNYSVSGVLKNAIDWASRPYNDNSFDNKPIAIMNASGGAFGAVRANFHLRQIIVALNMHPLNKPEVLVTYAGDKISNGKVHDQKTREKIQEVLVALEAWTKKLKGNH
jgi:chromate reductase